MWQRKNDRPIWPEHSRAALRASRRYQGRAWVPGHPARAINGAAASAVQHSFLLLHRQAELAESAICNNDIKKRAVNMPLHAA
jgi:hypothetical protein